MSNSLLDEVLGKKNPESCSFRILGVNDVLFAFTKNNTADTSLYLNECIQV